MAHTPGPWHRNIRAGGKYPVVFAGRNQHVAQVVQQKDGDETEANIDLVYAAPDLLAACLLQEEAIKYCGDVSRRNAADSAVLAAIAKAKGTL